MFELTAIGVQLKENGHDVYCVLPSSSRYIKSIQSKNITVLPFVVPPDLELMESQSHNSKINDFIYSKGSVPELTVKVTNVHCEYMMTDVALLTKVKNHGFDLAVTD